MSMNQIPGAYPEEYKMHYPSCPYMRNCHGGGVPQMVKYTIRAGDTLWNLAEQYNTTIEAIMAANPGIDPDNLQIGQMIMIPDPPPWHRGFGPWFRPWGPWYGPWYGPHFWRWW